LRSTPELVSPSVAVDALGDPAVPAVGALSPGIELTSAFARTNEFGMSPSRTHPVTVTLFASAEPIRFSAGFGWSGADGGVGGGV
jgi:hypothetical protein